MFATTTTTKERSIFTQFYTHNRTKQILEGKGIKVRKIERIAIHKPSGEFYRCVHVVYIVSNGARCSTFISCRDYLTLATQGRRERATGYTAHQDFEHPSQWRVTANVVQLPTQDRTPERGKEGRSYTVVTTPQAIVCDCTDFIEQPEHLAEHPYLWWFVMKERRICKHSVCVMSALGFGSLKDYLSAWKSEGRLSKLAATMNQQSRKRFSSTLNKRIAT